jgi:hypothetical protein
MFDVVTRSNGQVVNCYDRFDDLLQHVRASVPAELNQALCREVKRGDQTGAGWHRRPFTKNFGTL